MEETLEYDVYHVRAVQSGLLDPRVQLRAVTCRLDNGSTR